MFKRLLVFMIGVVFCLPVSGQDVPFNTKGEVIQTDVVIIEGTTETLFARAKLFFIENFNIAPNTPPLIDDQYKVVACKGLSYFMINYGYGPDQRIDLHYTIKIEAKEGKYRYSIYNLFYNDMTAEAFYNNPATSSKKDKIIADYKQQTALILADLQGRIIQHMSAPTTEW